MNIHFGVDYYPEHWPEERWETDAKLMKEMGIQVVRLAEFSWHKLEPEEGKYDFEWLDRAIILLSKYDIKTIMGTPSAAPPAWMINKYPDILPTDRQGRIRGFGGRHHDCQSNPKYRELIQKMVTALAQHYGKNENVIGWQPDNELGNSHHDLCTCDHCRNAFQKWLKDKYQTVDQLNHAWGTAFWSQEVNSFEEVFTPKITVTGENPSQMLDWNRFCSDLIVDFFRMQADIIRKYAPSQFITHNFMGFADKVNYYDLGKEMDFVSHDQYPGGFFIDGNHEENYKLAAQLDVVRGYKNQNFWIMEQQSGITGWEVMGRAPQPGQLSAWTLQSIAHGADAIVFFRWRVCAAGTEQYWHGILPHSGNPGRRYEELKDTIKEMLPIMEKMQGSMPNAEVGIVFSFDQEYAFKIQPHNPKLSYMREILKYYKPLYQNHVPTDFVPSDADFSKYKLLIAPLQYLMNPELEERYFRYVKKGGHLLLTMRTGVKDDTNICMTDRELPGRLADLAGVEVLDYDCLRDAKVKLHYENSASEKQDFEAEIWSDLMKCQEQTKVLATYASEFYQGEPAITSHEYGKGICYYVGTEPEDAFLNIFIQKILSDVEVQPLGTADEEVELMERESNDLKWIFVINHSEQARKYSMKEDSAEYTLIKGNMIGELKPFEVQILEKTK